MPRSVTPLLWTSRSGTSCPPTRSCCIATYVLPPALRTHCTPAAAFTQHHSPVSACLATCFVQPAARGGSGASVARSVRGGTRRARARAGAAKARQGDDIGQTENPLARTGGLTGQGGSAGSVHPAPVAPVKPALTPEELEAHRAAARARLAEDMGRDDGASVAAPSSVTGRGRRNRKRTRGGLARRASVKIEFAPRLAPTGDEAGNGGRRARTRTRRRRPDGAEGGSARAHASGRGRARPASRTRRAAPPSRRR